MEKATGKVKMNNKFLSLFRLYACATLFEDFLSASVSQRDENFSNVRFSLEIGKLTAKETEDGIVLKAYVHRSFSTFETGFKQKPPA